MQDRLDRWLAAAELQRSIRAEHGADADTVMAQAFADSTSAEAERTYREAMARNQGLRFRAVDANLPQEVLQPDETVFEVAVGAERSDTFPLLIVTDRRVLHVMDRLIRGWTILEQAPAGEVIGAEIDERLLSGLLTVHVRDGEGLSMKINEWTRTREVADLIHRLATGGSSPG